MIVLVYTKKVSVLAVYLALVCPDLQAQVLKLSSVYFAPKQSSLSKEVKEIIEKNAELILAHPEMEYEIEGNTERLGSLEENLKRARDRAEAVKKYLTSLGVKFEKEVSVLNDPYPGFAETESERRVVFKIIRAAREEEDKKAAKPEDEEDRPPSKFGVELSAQAFYSRMDSTDFITAGSATIVSNLNYRGGIALSYMLSEHWATSIFASLKYESYNQPSTKTLSNGSFLGRGFGAALKTKPTERASFILMGNYEQNPFIRATSLTDLTFDLPYIFRVSLGMDYDVAGGATGVVGAGTRVSTLFRTSGPGYTIDQGFGVKATVFIRNLLAKPIHANFSYYWQIENMSIATQIEQSLVFQLGWMVL